MKKRKSITVNDKKYWLYSYPTESKSNYNTMVCVREVGDKLPIAGLTAKHTENISDYRDWAVQKVNEYKNQTVCLH